MSKLKSIQVVFDDTGGQQLIMRFDNKYNHGIKIGKNETAISLADSLERAAERIRHNDYSNKHQPDGYSLPIAYDNCNCDCHRVVGVVHCVPCCYPIKHTVDKEEKYNLGVPDFDPDFGGHDF